MLLCLFQWTATCLNEKGWSDIDVMSSSFVHRRLNLEFYIRICEDDNVNLDAKLWKLILKAQILLERFKVSQKPYNAFKQLEFKKWYYIFNRCKSAIPTDNEDKSWHRDFKICGIKYIRLFKRTLAPTFKRDGQLELIIIVLKVKTVWQLLERSKQLDLDITLTWSWNTSVRNHMRIAAHRDLNGSIPNTNQLESEYICINIFIFSW